MVECCEVFPSFIELHHLETAIDCIYIEALYEMPSMLYWGLKIDDQEFHFFKYPREFWYLMANDRHRIIFICLRFYRLKRSLQERKHSAHGFHVARMSEASNEGKHDDTIVVGGKFSMFCVYIKNPVIACHSEGASATAGIHFSVINAWIATLHCVSLAMTGTCHSEREYL